MNYSHPLRGVLPNVAGVVPESPSAFLQLVQTKRLRICAAHLGNRLAESSLCEDNRSTQLELGHVSWRPPGPCSHARKYRRIELARVMRVSTRRFYGGKLEHHLTLLEEQSTPIQGQDSDADDDFEDVSACSTLSSPVLSQQLHVG